MLKQTLKTLTNCIIKSPKSFVLPYNLVVENTTRCNLNCQHCWRTTVEKPTDMEFDLYKRMIDEILPKKVNILGNGEPFIHPEVFEFIDYAKRKNCLVYTSTNGILIDKQKAKRLIDLHVDSIGVSIDAATKESYSKIRGSDIEMVYNALGYLSEAKMKSGYRDISIGVAFLIQKDNFHEIEDFAKKIDKYDGVDFISYQRLKFLSDKLKTGKDLLGSITYETIKNRIDKIKKWTKVKIIYDEHVANKMWKKNILSSGGNFTKRCIQPWYSAYITALGDVLPCCFFSAMKNLSMGNLNQMSFTEIWNGSNYKKFRSQLRRGISPYEVCAECYPFGLADYFTIEKRFIKMIIGTIFRGKSKN